MDSQRGKASSNASRQNKSQKQGQATKSQTNGSNNNNNNKSHNNNNNKPRNQPRNRNNRNRDLASTFMSSGRLGLSSGNRGHARKSHLIDEDEYIQDINGSVTFATTQFPINPGQSSTFPWGYKIAGLYEKYEFQYLEFYYRREVSEFATNGQAGKVMLSVDFDASDSAPTTKQQVLDTEPHVDGMPCTEKISLVVDCKQLRHSDGCYVRPGTQPANTDIKTYDAGNFFISTYGNTNTTPIGELRVRYKVLVSVPVLESGGSGGSSGSPGSFLFLTSNLAGETAAATTTYGALFASATTPVVVANGIGASIASTGLITLQPGSYLVESNCTTTDSAANVTGGNVIETQSATADTDPIYLFTGTAMLSNTTAGFTGWSSSTPKKVWNTTLLGTTICAQATATYASGVALNQAYIIITSL